MAKVLIVGCGDLGGEIARLLMIAQHEVVGVVRTRKKVSANNFSCLQADVTMTASLTPLRSEHPDIIIYCVAANAQTDENYRLHYVEGLRNVLATQNNNSDLKHVFFISSTRVYGQTPNHLINEDLQPKPADFGGERLFEAEGLLKQLSCRTTAIRLSGIYGPGRLAMVKMAKKPKQWPEVDKWTNRIHRDDAARFVVFLCGKVIAGEVIEDCYIGTDDMPVLQYDVLVWLAKKCGIKPVLKRNLETSGKRLSNKRMQASGFKLRYANYQAGYDKILNNEMSKND